MEFKLTVNIYFRLYLAYSQIDIKLHFAKSKYQLLRNTVEIVLAYYTL